MPDFPKSPDDFFMRRTAQVAHDANALKTQGTEYIRAPEGQCVAIVGNIETAPTPANGTEETGLKGWGIAVWIDGWVQVGAPAAGEFWQQPTLKNSWANYGLGFMGAGYVKDSLGFVHLRGLVKGGTPPSAVFVLPAGFRPAARLLFPSVAEGPVVARVDVTVAGEVIVDEGNGTWVCLNVPPFLAER